MSEHHRLAFWTKALNLPGFRVVHQRHDTPSDPIRFTVVPDAEVAPCPQCGHACDTVHRRLDSASIKDLPVGEQAVELIVHTPQFECERCQSYFTPTYPAVAPGAHATQRFLAHVARLIGFSDIANVAALYDLSVSTLTRWFYDYIERQQQQPSPATVRATSRAWGSTNCLKKKHRQFVCVIIDNTNKRVLDILEYRDKDKLVEYLRKEKSGLLASVEEVTCDMWEGYANAALEVFGEGHRVTIDRFHVMKNFQEQLTEARREIQRGMSKEEAKELKGTRWLWVKNWENLTAEEQKELEELKKRFPLLKQLAEQREKLCGRSSRTGRSRRRWKGRSSSRRGWKRRGNWV